MFAYDIENFEDILEQAELNAKSEWEIEFVESMRERYTKFKNSALVSEKQLEILERIACL